MSSEPPEDDAEDYVAIDTPEALDALHEKQSRRNRWVGTVFIGIGVVFSVLLFVVSPHPSWFAGVASGAVGVGLVIRYNYRSRK